MSLQNKSKGVFGEDLASEFLSKNGYVVIKRNFRSKFGEIDIIATKNNSLVFVEVKTRSSNRFGSPIEAVTQKKIENIQKTAEYFCSQNPKLPKKLVIEVLSVDLADKIPHLAITPVF